MMTMISFNLCHSVCFKIYFLDKYFKGFKMEQLASEIFNILKGANMDIVLYNDAGQKTLEPAEATRFYVINGDLLVTLRNDNSGQTETVVQIGTDFKLQDNKTLLNNIKSVTHNTMGEYKLRRFNKNIQPKDFSHQSVTEGYSRAYGSLKTSYIQMENCRLIIKHTKGVNEEIRGSRSRHIHSLFVEDGQGNRQQFPHKYMAGAKAMAMHVNNGGVFEDAKGNKILGICEEITDLNQFLNHVKRNKLVNEGNQDVVETCRSRMKKLKEDIRKLHTKGGYDKLAVEEKTEELDENSVDIAQRFVYDTFENRNMDSVLTTVARIVKEKETMDQINKETLASLYAMIEDGADFKLSLDPNDPSNPNNEDPKKYSGQQGPMAKVSSMLSYLAQETKNDEASNVFSRLSTAIHDMDKQSISLVVKVINHILKKGYTGAKKEESVQPIAETVLTAMRRKIS